MRPPSLSQHHRVVAPPQAPITTYTEIMSENKRAENHQTIAWLLERIHLQKKAEAKASSPFVRQLRHHDIMTS